MKIASPVGATPIVSSSPNPEGKSEAVSTPTPAELTSGVPKVQGPPVTISIMGKQIELRPGELAKVVDSMNEVVRAFNQEMQFRVGDGDVVVEVVDTATGEVLRQIPPEKVLDTYNHMGSALGLLLDVRL